MDVMDVMDLVQVNGTRVSSTGPKTDKTQRLRRTGGTVENAPTKERSSRGSIDVRWGGRGRDLVERDIPLMLRVLPCPKGEGRTTGITEIQSGITPMP